MFLAFVIPAFRYHRHHSRPFLAWAWVFKRLVLMWLSQETGATERTTGKYYHVTIELCADWNANWALRLEADLKVRGEGREAAPRQTSLRLFKMFIVRCPSLDMNYLYNRPHIKDSGSFDVSASGISFSLTAKIG